MKGKRIKRCRATRCAAGVVAAAVILLPFTLRGEDSRFAGGRQQVPPAVAEDGIAVYFSPEGGAAAAIIRLVGKARRSVRVQAFMFTDDRIRDALIDARRRGVLVELIMDAKNSVIKGSERRALRRAGITVYIHPEPVSMHSKVILIDDALLITGSFNLTWSADRKNVENLMILRDKPGIAKAYLEQFKKLKAKSKRYATQRK